MTSQQQVYDQWFKFADEDKDGAIAGAEAVRFFQRSSLGQDVLGQIWELASGGAPKLNNNQFASALRLVALAQANGGRMPIEQARVTLAGLGPALPIPRMYGMGQFGGPSYSPQTTGAAVAPAYSAQPTGGQYATYTGQVTGSVPAAYAAQATGYMPQATGYMPQTTGYMPQTTGMAMGYAPQATGVSMSYTAQHTGAAAAAGYGSGYVPQATGGAQFPPATPADLQKYGALFTQLDADKDGFVQGGECSGFFLQSGLDKNVLRDIWGLVAGAAGALNSTQFAQCMYLMELARKGVSMPAQLPPGQFPPLAQGAPTQTWSLQSQMGTQPAPAAPQAPAAPSLPAKFQYTDNSQTPAHQSRQPALNQATMSTLNEDERSKIAAELKEAEEREAKLFSAEDEAAKSRARVAAFNAALQEVTVFKRSTDVALLQAQDEAARLEQEVGATQKKYDKAYSEAQAQGEQSRQLREQIASLMRSKEECGAKMRQLEADIAAASTLTPADVARMEAEVASLKQTIGDREAYRDSKMAQVAEHHKQQAALQQQLAEVNEAAKSADAEVAGVKAELAALNDELAAARSSQSSSRVSGLLVRAAQVYRQLYGMMHKAGMDIPADASMSNMGVLTWVDDWVTGASDWSDLDADARGYVLVNAMPGQAIPKKTTPTTAAKAPPAAATFAHSPATAATTDAFGDSAFPATAPAMVIPPATATVTAAAPPVTAATSPFGDTPAFAAPSGFDDPPAFGAAPAFAPAASVSSAATMSAAPSGAGLSQSASAGAFGFDDAPAFSDSPAFPAAGSASSAQGPAPALAAQTSAAAPVAGAQASTFGFGDDAFGAPAFPPQGSSGLPDSRQGSQAAATSGFAVGFDDNAFS